MNGEDRSEENFRRALAGDRDAFATIVREHQSMVYSIAYNFTSDRGAAEELSQDVFLELYRSLPALDCAAHATAWLRRVTTHRCIDFVRSRNRRPKISLDEIGEPAHEPGFLDPLFSQRLGQMMAMLAENARAVIILRYQEDLEPAEISEVLGMPLNTVKSHLQRSLAMFRERWSKGLHIRSEAL